MAPTEEHGGFSQQSAARLLQSCGRGRRFCTEDEGNFEELQVEGKQFITWGGSLQGADGFRDCGSVGNYSLYLCLLVCFHPEKRNLFNKCNFHLF